MRNTIGASVSLILIVTTLLVTSVTVASAQPAQPAGPSAPQGTVSWRVEAGRDTVALRDIARTGTPVDASPVAWHGDGFGLLVRHTRPKGSHMHRFELSATHASDFALKTPLESLPRPKGDAFSRIEGRYEYRRYLFSNVLVRGFDIGAGLQGGGVRTQVTRHVAGDLEVAESRIAFRTALVTAARFRRARLCLEVDWANGAHVGRSSERHSADAASNRTRGGGGWLTDLVVAADIAISRGASIALQYSRSDEGLLSSHQNFTTVRRSWNLGVTYAK